VIGGFSPTASAVFCHSLSLASVKSRLVLPFWYRLTRVVLDKGPLNVRACMRACVSALFFQPSFDSECLSMCVGHDDQGLIVRSRSKVVQKMSVTHVFPDGVL